MKRGNPAQISALCSPSVSVSLMCFFSRLKTWHTLLLGLRPFLDDGLSGCQLVPSLHLDRHVELSFASTPFVERQGTARLHPLSCWMSKHEPCSTQTLECHDSESGTNSLTIWSVHRAFPGAKFPPSMQLLLASAGWIKTSPLVPDWICLLRTSTSSLSPLKDSHGFGNIRQESLGIIGIEFCRRNCSEAGTRRRFQRFLVEHLAKRHFGTLELTLKVKTCKIKHL